MRLGSPRRAVRGCHGRALFLSRRGGRRQHNSFGEVRTDWASLTLQRPQRAISARSKMRALSGRSLLPVGRPTQPMPRLAAARSAAADTTGLTATRRGWLKKSLRVSVDRARRSLSARLTATGRTFSAFPAGERVSGLNSRAQFCDNIRHPPSRDREGAVGPNPRFLTGAARRGGHARRGVRPAI